MAEPIKAGTYVRLGEIVHYLRTVANTEPSPFVEHVRKLLAELESCGFHSTLAAAQQFLGMEVPADPTSGRVSYPVNLQFGMIAETVCKVLYSQADNRQTIALDPSEVTKRLRDLSALLPAGSLLNDAQKELMDEAVRCIECGAYRAAAVMGWNLAYDYIRRWILGSGRLNDLNRGLAKVCPGKTPIAQYEDFFDKDGPNERSVIDAMAHQESGPIINGELRDYLVQYLRYRNKYAHATEKTASAAKTNAYVEHLIDIITSPPFV